MSILFGGCPATEPVKELPYVLPSGFPNVPFPSDNQISTEKVELGRQLFYDVRLSADNSISCASCHKQEFAFTDGGKQVSKGVNGTLGERNSPTIINTAYSPQLFMDGRASTLEQQAFGAMTNPAEMKADVKVNDLRLQQDSHYITMFAKAFGAGTKPTNELGLKAIATFVRSALSGNSRYDQYNRGNITALSESEIRGKTLFFSERTQCSACHSGYNFTDNDFHSTGLFTHYYDKGRFNTTKIPGDVGKFKTPTLRNIELTAPYMHDGHIATLEESIEHYNEGGKQFVNKDKRIIVLNLTMNEKQDLLAFLRSLTDTEFINNPKFSKK